MTRFWPNAVPSCQSCLLWNCAKVTLPMYSIRSIVQLNFLYVSVLWAPSCLQRADFLCLRGCSKWMAPLMHFILQEARDGEKETDERMKEGKWKWQERHIVREWGSSGGRKDSLSSIINVFTHSYRFQQRPASYSILKEWIYFILVVYVAPSPSQLNPPPLLPQWPDIPA